MFDRPQPHLHRVGRSHRIAGQSRLPAELGPCRGLDLENAVRKGVVAVQMLHAYVVALAGDEMCYYRGCFVVRNILAPYKRFQRPMREAPVAGKQPMGFYENRPLDREASIEQILSYRLVLRLNAITGTRNKENG